MLVKTDQLGSVQVKDSIFFKILLNNDVLKLAEDYLHRGNVTFELRKKDILQELYIISEMKL